MYIRAKSRSHWRWAFVGWRGSVMFGLYRPGFRQVSEGVWTLSTPFVLMNFIQPWRQKG